MARKKVIWLIKGLGRGGAERLLEISIPYFNRALYDYEVIYFLPHKRDVVPALEQANIPVFCPRVLSPLNIPGLYRFWYLLKKRRPDIIHIHIAYTGIIGRIISRLAGIKNIVYTEHNILEKYHPLTKILNLVTYPLNITAIAVSEEVSKSMDHYFPSRMTKHVTIKNGINLGNFRISEGEKIRLRESLAIPSNHKIVGNVAHLRPEKGHEYLLRTAKLVIEHYPQVTFLVVGREKYNGDINRLEAITKDLGIQNNVIFTGFREDVAALTSLFDVFVLSSLAEGLPLTLLEAMLQGKPPVATSVGGIPEVIENGVNGFVVPPRDPELLAEKILLLLKNEALWAEVSPRATQTIQDRFGVQQMVKDIEEVYKEVLDNR